MPFTAAHTAILHPLRKWKIEYSVSAVIAGSVVPDFESILQMHHTREAAHSGWGVLLIDFPLALLLCYFYHGLIKGPLLDNLSGSYPRRYIQYRRFNWHRYFMQHIEQVIFSLGLGISSHLLWDSFTHSDGLLVQFFPVLFRQINFLGTPTRICSLLQLISSITGCLFVIQSIRKLPEQPGANEGPAKTRWYWPVLFFISGMIFTGWLYLSPEADSSISLVIAAFGSVFYSLLIYSLFFRIRGWRLSNLL